MTFVYHRVFQLWAYTASMTQLLLRSTQSEDIATRVDVAFQGVEWIEIPTYLEGLTLETDVAEDLKELDARGILVGDRHLYTLSGVAYRGFVVAHLVKHVEDDADYAAPSAVYLG